MAVTVLSITGVQYHGEHHKASDPKFFLAAHEAMKRAARNAARKK
jgi:hypothetical protein